MKINTISLLILSFFAVSFAKAEDQVTAVGSTIVYTTADGTEMSVSLAPGESFPSSEHPAPGGNWTINSVEGEAVVTIGGVTVSTQAGAKVNFSTNALGEIGFEAESGSATVATAAGEVSISSNGNSFVSASSDGASAPFAGANQSEFTGQATFGGSGSDVAPAGQATGGVNNAPPAAPSIPGVPSIDVPSENAE